MQTPMAAKFSFHVHIKENKNKKKIVTRVKVLLATLSQLYPQQIPLVVGALLLSAPLFLSTAVENFNITCHNPTANSPLTITLSTPPGMARKLSVLLPVLHVVVCSCVRGR